MFHNEVLARGLAPTDAIQYMTQRNRWALGAMQLLRLENPITGKGLTPDQRLAYTTTLFGWFELLAVLRLYGAARRDAADRRLAHRCCGLGVCALLSGDPRHSVCGAPAAGPRLLPPILSLLFEILRMPAVLPATLWLLSPWRAGTFKVTKKGTVHGDRSKISHTATFAVLERSLRPRTRVVRSHRRRTNSDGLRNTDGDHRSRILRHRQLHSACCGNSSNSLGAIRIGAAGQRPL